MEKLIILVILFGISVALWSLYVYNRTRTLLWQKAMGWNLDNVCKKNERKKEKVNLYKRKRR